VLVTADGAPEANQGVVVSLFDGLTWDGGGSDPKSFFTDSTGVATIKGLVAPANSGRYHLRAAVDSAMADATVNVTGGASGSAFQYQAGGYSEYDNVPSGSQPIGNRAFLTPGGRLWYGTKIVAEGVTSAIGGWSETSDWLSFVSNGNAKYFDHFGNVKVYPMVDQGSTAVGNHAFLTRDGVLYYKGEVIDTNVASAFGGWGKNDWLTYVTTEGRCLQFEYQVPARRDWGTQTPGTIAVGNHFYLTPDGTLFYRDRNLASGVASAFGGYSKNYDWVSYVTADGKAYQRQGSGGGIGVAQYYASVPLNSAPVGNHAYHAVSGELFYKNKSVATDVLAASGGWGGSDDYITYTRTGYCVAN
jgi:hypothetical protein